MELRAGVVRALRRTLTLRVPAHVISRCHLHSQAAAVLADAGLRVHGSPDTAGASPAKTPSGSPAQTPSSKTGQAAARVTVHCAHCEGGLSHRDACALQHMPSTRNAVIRLCLFHSILRVALCSM